MKFATGALALLLFLFSCSHIEPTNNTKNKVFDEYQASPLAELMSNMADEFDLAKVKLRNDMQLPDNFADGFDAIKTAEPTPEKKN